MSKRRPRKRRHEKTPKPNAMESRPFPGNLAEILWDLRQQGVKFEIVDGRLTYTPTDLVPSEIQQLLRDSERQALLHLSITRGVPIRPRRQLGRVDVRRQKPKVQALKRAMALDAPLALLNDLIRQIDSLSVSPEDKDVLRENLGPAPDATVESDPVAFAEIIRRVASHRDPATEKFFDLYWKSYSACLAPDIASSAYAETMKLLRQQFEESGDRGALAAAVHVIEGSSPIRAAVSDEWVWKKALAMATKVLPMTGRGRTPSSNPEQVRLKNQDRGAVAGALPKLLARYDFYRKTLDHQEALQLTEDEFHEASRVKDPRRQALILDKLRGRRPAR